MPILQQYIGFRVGAQATAMGLTIGSQPINTAVGLTIGAKPINTAVGLAVGAHTTTVNRAHNRCPYYDRVRRAYDSSIIVHTAVSRCPFYKQYSSRIIWASCFYQREACIPIVRT